MTSKESTRISIKEWSEADRPREKMQQLGRKALSDAELLAIIIGSGNKEQSAVELARAILMHFKNDLDALERCDINYLCNHFNGIGEAKAISIIASLELGKRLKLKTDLSQTLQIKCSTDLYKAFSTYLHGLSVEEVWVLTLNKGNRIIRAKRISSGGIDKSLIDIKLVLHEALIQMAPVLPIAHNHPSGNTTPSQLDKTATAKLNEACKACDILLIDHIIVGDNAYFSFADEGLL